MSDRNREILFCGSSNSDMTGVVALSHRRLHPAALLQAMFFRLQEKLCRAHLVLRAILGNLLRLQELIRIPIAAELPVCRC